MLDTLPEVDLTAALEAEDERREQRGAVPSAPLPGRRDTDKRIGEFSVESDLSGPRVWFVRVSAGSQAGSTRERL